jgi:hypothetical protein
MKKRESKWHQAWEWKEQIGRRIDQQLVVNEREAEMATINWTAEPPVWEAIAATVPPVEVTP